MNHEFFFGHQHRANRGELEPIILCLLLEKPMHGYEIIRTLEDRSHGFWRPSPGSVYPILQFLEESDLVTSQEEEGKKVYEITDKGREQCHKAPEPHYPKQWKGHIKAGLRFRDMRHEIHDLVTSLREVAIHGTDAQIDEVKQMLRDNLKRVKEIVYEIETSQSK